MYPCINDQTDYGIAVNGIKGAGLPVSLFVNNQQEPDTRQGQLPEPVHGTVTVSDLITGHAYALYRYEGTASLPTDGTAGATAKHTTPFTASNSTWIYEDKIPFLSNTATYYRVFATSS